MSEPKTYKLEATELIPNSPYLLVHYPGFFPSEDQAVDAAAVYDVFARNGWETQWIFRYGPTQCSHYHSQTHECMAVLSGTATIRFGVSDMDEGSTYATRRGQGGLELHAKSGDVFVIPAGVSHKTYETSPPADLELLTPGEGRGIAGIDIREVFGTLRPVESMLETTKQCGLFQSQIAIPLWGRAVFVDCECRWWERVNV